MGDGQWFLTEYNFDVGADNESEISVNDSDSWKSSDFSSEDKPECSNDLTLVQNFWEIDTSKSRPTPHLSPNLFPSLFPSIYPCVFPI